MKIPSSASDKGVVHVYSHKRGRTRIIDFQKRPEIHWLRFTSLKASTQKRLVAFSGCAKHSNDGQLKRLQWNVATCTAAAKQFQIPSSIEHRSYARQLLK